MKKNIVPLLIAFMLSVPMVGKAQTSDLGVKNMYSTNLVTNLPIIQIDTRGQYISDDPKIPATFKVWDKPGSLNDFSLSPQYVFTVGIEVRGSSSQTFPKQSFGLEFRSNSDNNLDTNVTVFGFPTEEDFVLIANYSDKTLMRNALLYTLSNKIGRYAPRTQFCELYINNDYMGVYLFAEKVKRDNYRVNISKLEPEEVSGPDLTGGYILKIDKNTGGGDGWISPFPPLSNNSGQQLFIQYHYPDYEDINESQENYIRGYVTKFENALAYLPFSDTVSGYRAYMDVESAVDYFILQEIAKNIDSYRLSTFFYKQSDQKGGKLHFGPIWDYDLALKNANYYNGEAYWGWIYEFPYPDDWFQPPFWWPKMLSDPYFQQVLKCKWSAYRQNLLSTQNILHMVDSIQDDLSTAQTRNFVRWPILSEWVWPNPQVMGSYNAEVEVLRNFIDDRLAWLDINMPGKCTTPVASIERSFDIRLNFAENQIVCNFQDHAARRIELIDITGKIISSVESQSAETGISIQGLPPMVYIVRVQDPTGVVSRKIVW